jgi:hypothetical protein
MVTTAKMNQKIHALGEVMSKQTGSKIGYCIIKQQVHMTSKAIKPMNLALIVFSRINANA